MNRLAQESSPYLRQHAGNPVDWYPWGQEAFAAARERGVPLLLSVGYSTCHWCHVMAHESFENEAVAAYMNAHFVNIKIDREERPDVDGVYMSAVQAMTGSGGWPMTVFATPQGEPFYAGTYFPPQDSHGLPSFSRLLSSMAQAWAQQREKLLINAGVLSDYLRQQAGGERGEGDVPHDLLARAEQHLRQAFDTEHGGFGGAPKFPPSTTLSFLLSQAAGRDMALFTLRQMQRGGLHDQLGGGFHRYSVDERWLVPHFEKMLYDNAQLARTYLQAYQVSGDEALLEVAQRTLQYMERELLAPEGGFYSAQDADQEGIEGKVFVWTPQELGELLGEGAPLAAAHWGVTPAGNFRDPHHPEFGTRSVLSVARTTAQLAQEFNLSEAEVQRHLDAARHILFEARRKRAAPGLDNKMLTSWNGLALQAFADAARITGQAHYLEVAERNAEFIWASLGGDAGQGLEHVYGGKVSGLLEDQALYGLGLVALYQAGGDLKHLQRARQLWAFTRKNFWDEDRGRFYSTGGPAETLIARQAQAFDSAVMSDNAAAALLGVWMSRYFSGEAEGERCAHAVIRTFQREMLSAPHGFGGLWQVAAFVAAPHSEVALLGTRAQRRELQRELSRHFLPFTALAFAETSGGLEVLEGRAGKGVAYVCLSRRCDLPTSDPLTLRRQLHNVNPQET